jgi:hypothetical protein
LLADAGFVLPPELDRRGPGGLWKAGADQSGTVFYPPRHRPWRCADVPRSGGSQGFQDAADAAFSQDDTEPRQEALAQIAQPPTHHAILLRALPDPSCQFRLAQLAVTATAVRPVR